jgi:phenylpropionate dioxygenase-like ring-hydroxylating dioxygenase large terminal subunit
MAEMSYSSPDDLLKYLVIHAGDRSVAPSSGDYRVPVAAYTCKELAEAEHDSLFLQRPLALAHSSQLAEAGDAIVHDHLGLPLVTVRDNTGQVATFLNVCRHRGMRLIKEPGAAKLRSFVCPYHQWTYGLDGAIRNVPLQESFSKLNPEEHHLVSLPTEERHGFIWLLASPGGKLDLDGHLAGLGTDLDTFGLPSHHFFCQSQRTVACNWKLVQDAFLDGYHVVRLHRNTVGKFFPDSIALSDRVGDHVRSAVARNEIFTENKPQREESDLRSLATFSYSLFPNTILIMHPDYTSHVTLYPQGTDETVFVHSMLVPAFPETEKERLHYERSFELIDEGVFAAEDIEVCVGTQQGLRSGANEELLCGAHELSLKSFHDAVQAALGKSYLDF